MDVELTEIQKQIAEKWTIMWWALGFGLCALSVAHKEGFFKRFKASDLPVIKGSYVLMGFVLFVFMQLFVVPSLIISLLYLLGWNVHDIEHLTPLAKSWMNPPALLGGFGGMCLVFFSFDLKNGVGCSFCSFLDNIFLHLFSPFSFSPSLCQMQRRRETRA